jgi:hypothetical protein
VNGLEIRLESMRAAKLAAGMLYVNDDSVGGQVEVDIHDCPVVAKSEK